MNAQLASLVESVSGADSLESLTRPMLELLEAVTGLESTYLTTIDLGAGLQRILFSRNSRQMQIPEGLSVPWGDTLCRRAMEEGRPYTSDVATCWGDSQAARDLGIRTYVSQPIRTLDGGIFGTLCAASAESVALKPDTLDVLGRFSRLISQQVERERALREVQAENAELSAHALADPLTGLANRRSMERELQRMVASGTRDREPLHVAFVDLDGFKGINDRYGHDVGDRFLVHIARRLAAAMRPSDLVSRTGGDEFVVLSLGGDAAALRERLEQASRGLFTCGECRIDYAGASVGVAQALPGERDIQQVLKQADAAMYAVKRARKAPNGETPR